jgi:hypothetical protein
MNDLQILLEKLRANIQHDFLNQNKLKQEQIILLTEILENETNPTNISFINEKLENIQNNETVIMDTTSVKLLTRVINELKKLEIDLPNNILINKKSNLITGNLINIQNAILEIETAVEQKINNLYDLEFLPKIASCSFFDRINNQMERLMLLLPTENVEMWNKFAENHWTDYKNEIAFAFLVDTDETTNPLKDQLIISQIQSDLCPRILELYKDLHNIQSHPIELSEEEMNAIKMIELIKDISPIKLELQGEDSPYDPEDIDIAMYYFNEYGFFNFTQYIQRYEISEYIQKIAGRNLIRRIIEDPKFEDFQYDSIRLKATDMEVITSFLLRKNKEFVAKIFRNIITNLHSIKQKFGSEQFANIFIHGFTDKKKENVYSLKKFYCSGNKLLIESPMDTINSLGMTIPQFINFVKDPNVSFILNNWKDIMMNKILKTARESGFKSVLMETPEEIGKRINFENKEKINNIYRKVQEDYYFSPYEGTEFNRKMVSREAQTNGWFSFAKRKNL